MVATDRTSNTCHPSLAIQDSRISSMAVSTTARWMALTLECLNLQTPLLHRQYTRRNNPMDISARLLSSNIHSKYHMAGRSRINPMISKDDPWELLVQYSLDKKNPHLLIIGQEPQTVDNSSITILFRMVDPHPHSRGADHCLLVIYSRDPIWTASGQIRQCDLIQVRSMVSQLPIREPLKWTRTELR